MFKNSLLRHLFLSFAVGITCVLFNAKPLSAQILPSVLGILFQTGVHESGHAAMASYYGWRIESFKPYPHICGGRLVAGCVTSFPDENPYLDDGKMNRTYLRESRAVAAAGSLINQLSFLVFTPLVARTRATSFWGTTLRKMLFFQKADWIFYVATDSLTDFQGDWYSVAQSNNIPTYTYLAPATLSFWALGKYEEKFQKPTRTSTSALIFPRVSYLGAGNVGASLHLHLAI